MNTWFRISKFSFKILIAVCLFLLGASIGAKFSANWILFAIIAIVATAVIALVWFVGRLSATKPKIVDDEI